LSRHLVILGCSQKKLTSAGVLPAIERYNGPTYQVLRSFLRHSAWPGSLSVGVLSARYGLIGGLAPIEYYDQRMDWTPATSWLIWHDRHRSFSTTTACCIWKSGVAGEEEAVRGRVIISGTSC